MGMGATSVIYGRRVSHGLQHVTLDGHALMSVNPPLDDSPQPEELWMPGPCSTDLTLLRMRLTVTFQDPAGVKLWISSIIALHCATRLNINESKQKPLLNSKAAETLSSKTF